MSASPPHGQDRRIGMIGLGNMGARIARRLRDGGYTTVGFDINPTAQAQSEVESARSLKDLVRDCEVIFMSLPDTPAIESVVFGNGGLSEQLRAGQTLVDLSTANPRSSALIHAALSKVGAEFLDAGVSGGGPGADAGTLTVMVGGSVKALDAIRPTLDCFCSQVHHMGAPGSGHATKVINNFLYAIGLSAAAEALITARRFGLDLAHVLEVINQSSGMSFVTLNRFPDVITGQRIAGGLSIDLTAKDARLYLDLAGELGIVSLAAPACLGIYDLASARGYGDEVNFRLFDILGEFAADVRMPDSRSPQKADGLPEQPVGSHRPLAEEASTTPVRTVLRRATSGLAHLYHETEGNPDGPTLLLGTSLATTLRIWDPVVGHLAGCCRLVRYDHRGHGNSSLPVGPADIAAMGRDVLALLDELSLDRVSYAGVSLGGIVGMWLAAHAPERIERLVPICTTAYLPPRQLWYQRASAVRAARSLAIFRDSMLGRWLSPDYAASHPGVVDELAAMIEAISPWGYAACAEAVGDADLRADLHAISAPTLVIGAAKDIGTPPEHSELIADLIPAAKLAILPEGGHLSVIEHAGAVAALIKQHLACERAAQPHA